MRKWFGLVLVLGIAGAGGWYAVRYERPPEHAQEFTSATPTRRADAPTPAPSLPPSPSPRLTTVVWPVPFTSQSPLGEWSDPRQQDGCEEASALMAVAWARGETFSSREEAKRRIVAAWDYQLENFGSARDTSARDTAERLIRGYLKHPLVEVKNIRDSREIIEEIWSGKVVIVPTNGQRLGNPNFTGSGPERHMLVIKGFDPSVREFITNDPGTRQGEGYRYDEQVLWRSIRDYPTGDHVPISGEDKIMVIISKG